MFTKLANQGNDGDWVPTERSRDNPFVDLSSAACNLVADSLGVRYCGAISLDNGQLRGGSSEFVRLPRTVQQRTIDDIIAAVVHANFDADEAHSSQLVQASIPKELGGLAGTLLFPETDTIVFAIPTATNAVEIAPLRRAAVSVLPILYRLEDLKQERDRLIEANDLLAHVGELAKVGGWEQQLASGRLIWSDEIYAMHGLEPGGELSLDRVLQLYPSPAREKLTLELERAAAEGGGFDLTTPIKTPRGEPRVVRTVGRTHQDSHGRTLYGITQDVTQQLSTERRLWWAANHDPVTSLPNRLLFEDRIQVAVNRATRDESHFALLVIEIADPERAAEFAGYTVPDKRMLEIAGRLSSISRASDTVARLSINEFAILFDGVDSVASLEPAMTRLREQIEEMRALEGRQDAVVMSCGVAFFPRHANEAEGLMRAAEIALAEARRKLDEPIVVFGREIADDAARRRETVLSRARESLAKREFVPYYQPQIDIETGEVVGAEALVRWQTPDMLLDAKDFAYALDDHEIGSRVSRVVLDNVIEDLARLKSITQRPFRISINASRTEVLRNDFLDTFLAKVQDGNLKPTDFIIEITEDVILAVDDQTLHDKISYLVSSGVEFSLDDFGTGYASLIHISSFPIKEIKIDKQFIFGIEKDRRKRAIVRGIIQIARSMGLNVIAEGVETAEQEETLREIGCRYVQGWLHSFPMPFSQFSAMLKP